MASPLSSAQAAFDNALSAVRAQHPANSQTILWLHDKHTQSDVQDSIEKAKAQYEGRSNSKARKWLGRLSTGILGYGKVMDVLAQHHPEYVSLAWGTTKLLLILFEHHEELVSELARSMSEISDILPRTDQYLALYNDTTLQGKVEQLFVLFVEHSRAMLKFYQEGRLKHAWKAFIQPYEIRFKDLKDGIDVCSRSIEQYVQVKLHLGLDNIHKDQLALIAKVGLLDAVRQDQAELRVKIDLIYAKICKMQTDTALLPSMALTLQETQISDMINFATDARLPHPTDSLELRRAFCKRHAAHYKIRLEDVWTSTELTRWSTSHTPSTLVIQGSALTRKEVHATGTHMIQFIQESNVAILWALPSTSSPYKLTWTGLLRSLVTQALQLNGAALCNSQPQDFSILNIATATSATDWERALTQALKGVQLVYIVVDLSILDDELLAAENIAELHESLGRLLSGSRKTMTMMKFAVLNDRRTMGFAPEGAYTVAVDGLARRAGGRGNAILSAQRGRRGQGRVPLAFRRRDVRVS